MNKDSLLSPSFDEEEFFEIDIEKKLEKLNENINQKNSEFLEKFKTVHDIAPLYVHEIFRSNSEDQHDTLMKMKKNQKDKGPQGSIFLNEKLEKQNLELKQKKLEMRMSKKNVSNSERKNFDNSKYNKDLFGVEEVIKFNIIIFLLICYIF